MRSVVAALALLLVGGSLGCGGGNDSPETSGDPHAHHDHAGHHHAHHDASERPEPRDIRPVNEKHAQLLRIAQQVVESREAYFGREVYETLSAADTTSMTRDELAAHDFQIGWELFKLGKADEAEAMFARSDSRVPSSRTKYWLGVTQMRIGEQQNCILRHSPESCVFPLAGDGIHQEPGGAERALVSLRKSLADVPLAQRSQVRWFINLAAMALGSYPGDLEPTVLIPPERFASQHDVGRFPDIAMDLDVAPMNLAGGAAIEDFDGDGFLDIITSSADLLGPLKHYRNRGDGTFDDVSAESGLEGQIGGLNLVHADYDGDGAADVLILRGGWMGMYGQMPNSLLRNRGDGRFEDVTISAGLAERHYPSQVAAFADYDLDGDLDLFQGNEMPPPQARQKFPCQLFRNEGNGRFTDVTDAAGVHNYRLTKGAAWGDYDNDRDPDLFVSNQFGENRLYRNDGDGKFVDVAPAMGLNQPEFSFPTWFWDYNNDGALDLFVAGYRGDLASVARSYIRPSEKWGHNTLFENRGAGEFVDVAKSAGLLTQTLVMGANFGDLDNDGYLDFYLGTGAPQFDLLVPNVMYRSDGEGGFQDVTTSGGFGNLQKGHGIAFGDLDNDGDQDIYLQSGGIFAYDSYFNSLFLNPGHGNRWITLRLEGVESNRDAFGARVHVRTNGSEGARDFYRWVGATGSFGSSSRQLEIGLGKAEEVQFVEVYWPKTDKTQRFDGLELDTFYRLREGDDEPKLRERKLVPLGG